MARVPLNSSPGAGRGGRSSPARGPATSPSASPSPDPIRPKLRPAPSASSRFPTTGTASWPPSRPPPAPRPDTAALDSLFARFRGPVHRLLRDASATERWRDSLRLLRNRGSTRSRATPRTTRKLFATFERLSDSLAEASAPPRLARRTSTGPAPISSPRSESLRARDPTIGKIAPTGDTTVSCDSLAARRRQEPLTDTTDAARLGPAFTWARARGGSTARRGTRPIRTQRWYWNVPADADTILLSSRTGRRRPRY